MEYVPQEVELQEAPSAPAIDDKPVESVAGMPEPAPTPDPPTSPVADEPPVEPVTSVTSLPSDSAEQAPVLLEDPTREPEPAPAPVADRPKPIGHWTASTWGGLLNYQCAYCPFDCLDEEVIATHFDEAHPLRPDGTRENTRSRGR
jgi:hypothetical protein